MMNFVSSRCADAARSAVAVVCSIAMAVALVPACAFGSQDSTTVETVSCGGGWVLSCTVTDEGAQVTGVAETGNGVLVIPDAVNGRAVTTIGARAFFEATVLSSITIPSTVTTFGEGAFYGSGLVSIHIPASLTSIPENCFRECAALEEVTFDEGMTLFCIEQRAFSDCVSLKQFTFPPLTGTTYTSSYAIGIRAFSGCTALSTFTFLDGGKNDASYYFYDSTCIADCKSLQTFVFYCKKANISQGLSTYRTDDATTYYTVDFYNTEEDASACQNRVARVTLPAATSLKDIAQGTADITKAYSGSDAIPAAPQGKVWGFSDHALKRETSTLGNSYKAVAVDPNNLDYGYFTSPEAENYADDPTLGMYNSDPLRSSRYFLNDDGETVDLSDLKVYGPSFEPVDSSMYTLSYEKQQVIYGNLHDHYYYVEGVDGAGEYRITAQAKEPYTSAYSVEIYVDTTYYPETTLKTGTNVSKNANVLMDSIAKSMEETPFFVVAAPTSDWRYELIAGGLAGVGEGFTVYVDEDSDAAYQAIIDSGVDAVTIVGDSSVVSEEVEERICNLSTLRGIGSVDRLEGETVQETALNAYQIIKEFGPSYGYSWGSTAVIASPAYSEYSILAARVAHDEKAPVFFTEGDGSLSADLISALKDGGFSKVVIAGGESAVSAHSATQVQNACGFAAQRISTTGDLCQDSLELAKDSGSNSLVVASAKNPVSVLAAQEYAAAKGSRLVTIASSADLRTLASYVMQVNKRSFEELVALGDFSACSSDLAAYFDNLWLGQVPEQVGIGDTISAAGCLYKITGSSTVSLVAFQGLLGRSALAVNSVSCGGATYKVTAASGVTMAGTSISKVTLGSNVKTLDAGLFAGASKLASVSLGGPVTKLAANAFKGCSKLKTLTISSAKLNSVGAGAFQGCKALKTLIIKSCKIKKAKIAAGAFGGVPATATVAVPKKKLNAYKKMFVAKGLSDKAKFKAC